MDGVHGNVIERGKKLIKNWEDSAMAFDFKKEYKEFYMPKNKPSILTVPPMNYIAVRGHGDPNLEDGEYKQAISK
jgi:hypothetical protein